MLSVKKRKPSRSGIERAPKRDYPAHRKFVRSFECIVPDCDSRGNPHAVIECAHISYGIPLEDAAALSMKAHDAWSVSLCSDCHRTAHGWGHDTFFSVMARVDAHKIAVELCRASPVPEIRAKSVEMAAWLNRGAAG